MRTLYEIAKHNKTTVGELTGSRRRYSVVQIPEPIAQRFGLSAEESRLHIEHYDEGLSASEIPYIRALWELHNEESKRGGK